MPKGRVTLQDVARLAGVSQMTVSRALLTGPHLVAQSTRERTLAAAEELGYVPDLAASALASRRSRLVTALISTFSVSIFAPIIEALDQELALAKLQLLVGQTSYSTESEAALVRTILGRKPDALVMTSSVHSDETKDLIEASGIPVVEIWDLPDKPFDSAIGFRNRVVGEIAGKYLAERHYERPAFVSENPDHSQKDLMSRRAASRWDGFSDSYRTMTGRYPQHFKILTGFDYEAGSSAIEQIINSNELCDAIFFDSDILAAGAVFKCQELGLRLPTDIAVLGFGGFPISKALYPVLSTIEVPLAEIGQLAGIQLKQLLSGNLVSGKTVEVPLTLRKGATA